MSQQELVLRFDARTVRRLWRWAGLVAAVVLLVVLVPVLRTAITMVIFALFLAFLLDPVVNFLENRGADRLLAVVLVFVVILSLAVMGIRFLTPVISNEIRQMNEGLENQSSVDVVRLVEEKLGATMPILANPRVKARIQRGLDGLLEKGISVLFGLLSGLVSLVMVAFITFFFLKDGRRMKKRVISWVPNRYFEMALIILHKTSTQLGRYLRGQLLVAFIVGVLSVTALYLLNVRYYFLIGTLAGLANMIPYFGPLVGALPAVVIAFVDTGSFGAVAAVAVAFACIQLFENIFVSPFVVAKSVQLHPLTIILAILVGGQLGGIFGMLLAVPATSILKVTATELIWGFKNYRIR